MPLIHELDDIKYIEIKLKYVISFPLLQDKPLFTHTIWPNILDTYYMLEKKKELIFLSETKLSFTSNILVQWHSHTYSSCLLLHKKLPQNLWFKTTNTYFLWSREQLWHESGFPMNLVNWAFRSDCGLPDCLTLTLTRCSLVLLFPGHGPLPHGPLHRAALQNCSGFPWAIKKRTRKKALKRKATDIFISLSWKPHHITSSVQNSEPSYKLFPCVKSSWVGLLKYRLYLSVDLCE